EAGSLRDRLVEQRQVQKQLADSIDLLVREADLTAAELRKQDGLVRDARRPADDADRAAAEVAGRLGGTDTALALAPAERDARQEESTAARVALGRAKEQHAALSTRAADLDATLRQRKVDAVNLASAERAAAAKRLDAELNALRATQAAADAYRDKE